MIEPGYFAKTAKAAIPTTLGYQGRLKNAAGTALTGTYSFTIRLYTSSTGGTAVWTETQSVSVDASFFSVQLGSVTPFPASVDFNQPLYISTQISPDPEMSPRIPINSVAYAYTAGGVSSFLAAPVSATGGRMYYDASDGSLNYYDGLSSAWKSLGISTGTFQSVTAAGNVTTDSIQFSGGTSTGQFNISGGGLSVVGQSNLQDVSGSNATFTSLAITGGAPANLSSLGWTNATGTNTTSTNLFATTGVLTNGTITNGTIANLNLTNGTSTSWFGFSVASGTSVYALDLNGTNLNSGNVTLTGGTINGISIGSLAPSSAVFTSVSSTDVTSTNLYALNATFQNLTVLAGAPMTLADLIWTNATGTNTTSTNLAVLSGLSLPNNSVTDAMVVDGLTVDQTGSVSATSVNSGVLGNAGVTLNLSGFGSVTGTLRTSNVMVASTGTTDTLDLQTYLNILVANGSAFGGLVTQSASGTMDVSGGQTLIASDPNDPTATVFFSAWAESTGVSVPFGQWVNVYVWYNNGSPVVVSTTTDQGDDWTYMLLAKVLNDGSGTLQIHDDRNVKFRPINSIISFLETGIGHVIDNGCLVSSSATRNLAVTACDHWYGGNHNILPAFDSSVTGTFNAYFRDGSGGFNRISDQTQWDNLNFDDGSGVLAPLGAGEFGVIWIYHQELPNKSIVLLYGRQSYTTFADAQAAAVPMSLPPEFLDGEHAFLISEVIFGQGGSTPLEIRDLRPIVAKQTSSSGGGGVTEHNDLAGLQGGSAGEFYHLTATGFDAAGALHFSANGGNTFLLHNNSTATTEIAINNTGGGVGNLNLVNGNLLLAGAARINNAGYGYLNGLDLAGGGITNAGAISGISNLTVTGTTSLATLTLTDVTGTSVTTTNLFADNAAFTNLTVSGLTPSAFDNLVWTNATGTNTTSTNLFAINASTTNLEAYAATITHLMVTHHIDAQTVNFTNAIGDNLTTYGTVSSSFIRAGDTILNNTTAHQMVIDESLRVGVGNFPIVGNAVAQFGDTTDTYLQVNIQNHSTGTSASSDFVATNDIGNDSSYYIDMGINGSGYSVPEFSIGGANDAYLYANGNNLTIGTASASTALIFHAGGTTAADEVMRITSDHYVGIGTTSPSTTFHVVGDSRIDGTLTVTTASSSILFFGSSTGTQLAVTSLARLPTDTRINDIAVCLLDGTNCPSGTTPNLQTVTNTGNTTTNAIQFNGGTSTGAFTIQSNLAVSGTTVLEELFFTNGTGTHLDFALSTPNPSYTEGRLFYDNVVKGLSYYTDRPDVTVDIGKDVLVRVYNGTGSTITNGQLVYAAGIAGNSLSVALAKADSTSTARTIGMVTGNIVAGGYGFAIQAGLVDGLDTSSLATSTYVFLSDGVAGGYTAIRPLAPSVTTLVGVVVKSDSTDGVVDIFLGAPSDGKIRNGGIAFGTNDFLTDDKANLFWDDSLNRLGIGTDAPSSTLHVVGTSQFDSISFTSATGSTIFLTNLMTSGQFTVSGLADISSLTWSNATGTNTTGTNIYISGSARLPSDTQINNLAVCLLDGTNCPSGTSPNFQTVTNTGNTTTKDIAFNGGTSTGSFTVQSDLTVTGTTALKGLTFDYATGSYVDFVTSTAKPAYLEGRLFYDNVERSLAYFNNASSVTVNLGQEMMVYAYNGTGATILNGQAVYAYGSDLDSSHVGVALAKADATSTSRVLGLATEDIPSGGHGYVTNFGLIHYVDTSGFTAGSMLYLSNTTAGALTSVRPLSPGISVLIGTAVRSDATSGIIEVQPSAPRNGQIDNGGIAFGSNDYMTDDAQNLYWDNVTKRLGIGTNVPSSTLHVIGSTQLQTLTFTDSTGTSATTTNLFTTNGRATNFVSGNVTLTGGTIDGTIIGLTTPSLAVFSDVTSTNATTTNLAVLTNARLPSDTRINNTQICLLDGTNCPSSTAANFQVVTNAGNTTTNSIIVYGGITTSYLTATGTVSLGGTTFSVATGTSVTTTNFFSTNGTLTNGTITNGTISNLSSTNGTSTSWFGFATASGTTINALNSNFNGLVWTNATGTNTTSTNLGVTGLANIASLTVSGGTNLVGLTWTNATGTNTTSTNLGVTGLANIASLTVTGASTLAGTTWTAATGTSVTTTNLFSANGRFNLLSVSSTDPTGNTLSVAANGITSGNGLVIDYASNAVTTGAAFLIRDNGVTNFAVGSATGLIYNATGTKSAIFTLATSTAYVKVATGNLIVGNSTSSAILPLTGNSAYVQGTLEVGNQARFDSGATLGAVTPNAVTNWTNSNIAAGGIESIRSLQPFNGYLYAGRGDSAGDGDVMLCDPTLGGDSTVCDVSADWATSTDSATASVVSVMTVFQSRLYVGEGDGANLGLIRYCNPALTGSATKCDSGDWATATSTGLNIVRAFATYNGRLVAAADSNLQNTGAFFICDPTKGGNTNECDSPADWSRLNLTTVANGTGYEQIPTLTVYLGRLYALTGISSGDNDVFVCNPATAGDPETCDDATDWTRTINNGAGLTSYQSASVYKGYLYLGTAGAAGTGGTLQRCDPAFTTDSQLCDAATDITTLLASAGTITSLPAMMDFDGVLMFGREGTSAGDGKILEYRVSYATTTDNTAVFQATYAFANYNGVLYAGRGNATGNGQVWYYKRARQASSALNFEAGSSTGSVWFSQESLNSLGDGQPYDAKSGAFKFSHGIITEAGAYDLAEQYPVSETGLEAGDVVSLDPVVKGSVIKSRSAYDPRVVGVISTKPGFTLSSEQKEGTMPVALVGRVPVKFSTENGKVKAGDPLTSASMSGYAMKATKSGFILGRAIQDFAWPEGVATTTDATGTVMIAAQPGYYFGSGTADSAGQLEGFLGDATSTEIIEQAASGDVTALLEVAGGTVNPQVAEGSNTLSDVRLAQIDVLVVRTAAVIAGDLTVGGTVRLTGHVVVADDTAGIIDIPVGEAYVEVKFKKPYLTVPVVVVTPESDAQEFFAPWMGRFRISKKTVDGFRIDVDEGACLDPSICGRTLRFNWLAVGTLGSATSTNDGTALTPTTTQPVVEQVTSTAAVTDPGPTMQATTTEEIVPAVEGPTSASATPPSAEEPASVAVEPPPVVSEPVPPTETATPTETVAPAEAPSPPPPTETPAATEVPPPADTTGTPTP